MGTSSQNSAHLTGKFDRTAFSHGHFGDEEYNCFRVAGSLWAPLLLHDDTPKAKFGAWIEAACSKQVSSGDVTAKVYPEVIQSE